MSTFKNKLTPIKYRVRKRPTKTQKPRKKQRLLTPEKPRIQKCPGAPVKKVRFFSRARLKPLSATQIFPAPEISPDVENIISELMKYTL